MQKLKALKKAYADIIFNTTKDAAARVMSSERKAARYQHELKVSKEEALQMLLRLKQMMDFKVNHWPLDFNFHCIFCLFRVSSIKYISKKWSFC